MALYPQGVYAGELLVRIFQVFGLLNDKAVSRAEITAEDPGEARRIASGMFGQCPVVEVWEQAILIARIRRDAAAATS